MNNLNDRMDPVTLSYNVYVPTVCSCKMFASPFFQPTVIRVLEYHVNWFEATGFSKEQVCFGDYSMHFLSQNILMTVI